MIIRSVREFELAIQAWLDIIMETNGKDKTFSEQIMINELIRAQHAAEDEFGEAYDNREI